MVYFSIQKWNPLEVELAMARIWSVCRALHRDALWIIPIAFTTNQIYQTQKSFCFKSNARNVPLKAQHLLVPIVCSLWYLQKSRRKVSIVKLKIGLIFKSTLPQNIKLHKSQNWSFFKKNFGHSTFFASNWPIDIGTA